PFSRLRIRRRPGLASNDHLAIRKVLDAQSETVPSFRLPGEGLPNGPLFLNLPGGKLDSLNITQQHQLVALCDDSSVTHLPTLFHSSNIGLDRVIRSTCRPEEGSGPLEGWRQGALHQRRVAIDRANRI